MKTKKLLALLLTLALLVSVLPMAALPAAAVEPEPFGIGTWEELLTALASGGAYRLTANVTAPPDGAGLTVPKDKTVKLDLSGYTINADAVVSWDRTFVISVAGVLALSDSSSAGTGVLTGSPVDGILVNNGGTFTMDGGTITGNGFDGVNLNGGAFRMDGGTITGNGHVGVWMQGGEFTMTGGKISGNGGSANSSYTDTGIFIDSGTFTMSGGEISGNGGYGVELSGSEYKKTGGTFTMTGGEISGNDFDGVFATTYSAFTMSGGKISGNGANTLGSKFYFGGVDVHIKSKFSMTGGTISGNDNYGVRVDGMSATEETIPTVFEMNGGTISDNQGAGVLVIGGDIGAASFAMLSGTISDNDECGVHSENGTFTMGGGTISGNGKNTNQYYDGVQVVAGTFTMTGGEISASMDCGVEVVAGTFTMTGGTISNSVYAGVNVGGTGEFIMENGTITGNGEDGVTIFDDGTFTMTGGTISDNGANDDESYYYGGVYIGGGAFTMEDGMITGNDDDGVYVDGGIFAMLGGTISSNPCGVYISGYETDVLSFAMLGGMISDNTGDGVYVVSKDTDIEKILLMIDGTVSGNGKDGFNVEDGDLLMIGGTISENAGDGVRVMGDDSFFIMLSGTISDNQDNGVRTNCGSAMGGGTISGNGNAGVYVESGWFNMRGMELDSVDQTAFDMMVQEIGKEIPGSETDPEYTKVTISGNRYGVYVYGSDAEFTVGGIPEFADNLTDVYLYGTAVEAEDGPAEYSSYIEVLQALTTEGITVDVEGEIPENGLFFAYPEEEEIKPFNFVSARKAYHVELDEYGRAYLIKGEVTIALNRQTLALTTGGTATLTYTLMPDSYAGAVTFASSNTGVAVVDENGKVTAAAPGSAVITATTESGSKAVCTVTVTNPEPDFYYDVTYQITVAQTENGTAKASRTEAAAGEKITVTAEPDAGYALDSITVKGEKVGDVAVQDGAFTMPADDVTVTITFKPAEAKQTFSDVAPEKWYYEAVEYVAAKGIMQGPAGGVFRPNEIATRAMAAQVIWNLAGRPEASAAIPFDDVDEGAWYADAVRWAAENGFVTGWTAADGRQVFAPTDKVTREQFATMLYRYAKSLGKGFTGFWAFRLDFPDASDVSDWAAEAVSWMVMQGVIIGMDGKLNPQGSATRAQIALMLQRFDTLE